MIIEKGQKILYKKSVNKFYERKNIMGLFDNIVNKAAGAAKNALKGENKTVDVVFDKLPDTYEEFISLPQAQLSRIALQWKKHHAPRK